MRKGWSQKELAEKLGIKRGKLALVECGITKSAQLDDVINLSKVFSISTDSLLKVDLGNFSEADLRGLETSADLYAKGASMRILATTVDTHNNDCVELVPEKAKAGYRTGYADPQWIAALPQYSFPGLSKNRKYRVFPISGDSMLPYPDGCYIIGEYVDNWLDIKNDTLCVLILKSEGGGVDFVFKQVENCLKLRKTLLAKSLNPFYAPFEVSIHDVIEIWKYKYHFSGSITESTNISQPDEQVLRLLQSMSLELNKLSHQLLRT